MTRLLDRFTLRDLRLTSLRKVVALSWMPRIGLFVGVTQYWAANMTRLYSGQHVNTANGSRNEVSSGENFLMVHFLYPGVQKLV